MDMWARLILAENKTSLSQYEVLPRQHQACSIF